MTTITINLDVVHRLADADRALLARAVAALELLVTPDAPGLAPPGRFSSSPKANHWSSACSEIPIGMDGIQTFRPANYDGPISAEVTAGNGTVAPEGDSGDVFRVSPADDAAEGDTITVKYSADERHGGREGDGRRGDLHRRRRRRRPADRGRLRRGREGPARADAGGLT
jgi:hypothetical protein